MFWCPAGIDGMNAGGQVSLLSAVAIASDILDVTQPVLGLVSPLHDEHASEGLFFPNRFTRFMFRSRATYATG